ncbi:uncharacterized protein LOC119403331 [Rhipicephalus sanguineus]|uniref:uncharacterized protein LOC119403331 n=1 Tax=Rhipicephalus sanguineus TaxID=34632 RepID=UPI0020C4282D|nr:uncharacterized protein LOC119403331 [Rhipicephalus sanguineus]
MDVDLPARKERERVLARERQRRYMADEAVRAQRAAAARRRRQADPSLVKAQTAAARQRRQANPELKAREAAAARQRRQADPELRARQAAAARQRRQANPELKAWKAQYTRQKRQANPDLRQREAAAKRQRRAAQAEARPEERRLREVGGADARFKADFLDRSFGNICKVCEPLCFDNTLTKIRNIRSEQSRGHAMAVLQLLFPATSRTDYSPAPTNDEIGLVLPKREPEEIVCAVDCSDGCFPTHIGPAPIKDEVGLLLPKREPEEIVCAVDCSDGYLPTHMDSSDGNAGPYSPKSEMEELGITTEGSNAPSLLGPPCKYLFDPSHCGIIAKL